MQKTVSSTEEKIAWKQLAVRPSPAYPVVNWSPAVEVEVTHARFDAPSQHPYCPGLFIDRHVVENASLIQGPEFTRDTPGCDEIPHGASVSLASGPRLEGAEQGGEIYEENDGRTRFQRDWDFLETHVQRAFERYRALNLPLLSSESYLRRETELSEWRKAEALALYARNWKSRIPRLAQSNHAVDMLICSFHCGGVANILFALASVAGLRARRVTISHHSMVEIEADGQWVWCDNIVSGAAIMPCSFYEMLEKLPAWPNLSARQKNAYKGKEPFYRSPFSMSAALSWRGSGFAGAWPGHGDVAGGGGLCAAYNPATAKAIYPNAAQHRIPGLAQDGTPCLILKEKQGWIRIPVKLAGDEALRSVYYLSACDDNPIQRATARIWVGDDTPAEALEVHVDGNIVRGLYPVTARFVHPALEIELPAHALTPGEHEIVLRGRGSEGASVVLYPDLIEPAQAVASPGIGFDPEPDDFETDPVFESPHLAAQKDEKAG